MVFQNLCGSYVEVLTTLRPTIFEIMPSIARLHRRVNSPGKCRRGRQDLNLCSSPAPKATKLSYLIEPLSSALRRLTWLYLVFGHNWTQIGPIYIARQARSGWLDNSDRGTCECNPQLLPCG
jgi:hypothetical protein